MKHFQPRRNSKLVKTNHTSSTRLSMKYNKIQLKAILHHTSPAPSPIKLFIPLHQSRTRFHLKMMRAPWTVFLTSNKVTCPNVITLRAKNKKNWRKRKEVENKKTRIKLRTSKIQLLILITYLESKKNKILRIRILSKNSRNLKGKTVLRSKPITTWTWLMRTWQTRRKNISKRRSSIRTVNSSTKRTPQSTRKPGSKL